MDGKEAMELVWQALAELDKEICIGAEYCKEDYLLGYGTALLDLKDRIEKLEEEKRVS